MSKMPESAVLVKLTKVQVNIHSELPSACVVLLTTLCLWHPQRALTAKTRAFKSMSAEANAKELDSKVKEFSLQVMKRDLFDSKERLLKEKREKQKVRSDLNALRQQLSREPHSSSPLPVMPYKTIGSGYRISTAYAYEWTATKMASATVWYPNTFFFHSQIFTDQNLHKKKSSIISVSLESIKIFSTNGPSPIIKKNVKCVWAQWRKGAKSNIIILFLVLLAITKSRTMSVWNNSSVHEHFFSNQPTINLAQSLHVLDTSLHGHITYI